MNGQAKFDVVVIGGGHAGCEAAAAAARMGVDTALITQRLSGIGEMSCNPAIGGVGKGHLVREIDALDGLMGRAADYAGIQFRLLNRRKGPAVQGPRAQADRLLYKAFMQQALRDYEYLTLIEAEVIDIEFRGNVVAAVVLADGSRLETSTVVIATGTFLNGEIHQGKNRWPAGRMGDAPSLRLSEKLYQSGMAIGRLKTGTPARLDGKSIDWSRCSPQPGDAEPELFSFMKRDQLQRQICCHITHTSEATHDIIRDNFDSAPIYTGQVSSSGPRYCPSIEDKVVRFADKQSHQIFLEPEGLSVDTIYPNGISTSLEVEAQAKFLKTIPGLEDVKVEQFGYAIEYDYVDPMSLSLELETKAFQGLFLAGQINGTTGYEEAGAQGLLAGLNAACRAMERPSVTFDRSEAYIGVMIDDLVTRGVSEPYRMFTSRAEYRLTLRADNADQRLTGVGIDIGCVSEQRAQHFRTKMGQLDQARADLEDYGLTPVEAARHGLKLSQDGKRRSARDLLSYPDISMDMLKAIWPDLNRFGDEIYAQIEIDAQYAGYLDRQKAEIEAFRRDESLELDPDMDYQLMTGLSMEVREKLNRIRPATIGQASRIDGITPAALVSLLRHVRRSRHSA
ncbi:MAG: tRNA uridine-5-carboxymethylaminomethyl(34) synthesis enzyme MnmG [Hyphomicrobiales bacterium]|nr:MAG: tRNA uridine-5-carboxymethylaminomethyl(34) synthesis enzyme MnmG [Hyphomicrobiales bacterium]